MKPTRAVIEEAKRTPNAWIYTIEGDFGDSAVPPESIVGAWKTASRGEVVGEFIPNPNHKPKGQVHRHPYSAHSDTLQK